MKVSVIVPAFNAEATLEAAVTSLLATGYPQLEILVVDDGSCDATLPFAQGLEARHPEVVRVFTHGGNRHYGVSASRNLGIRKSSGQLIAFLDADDVVLPHRFQFSVPMLCERPDVDGVYELTRIVNCGFQNDVWEGQWRDGAIFGMAEPLDGEELFRKLMTGIPWGTCAFLCRRSLFDRIGLFDEARSMAEDCHLWIRAAAAAKIVPADPLSVVSLYIRHATNSYNYSLERRIDLLDAMAHAGQWIKQHSTNKSMVWLMGFIDYYERTTVAARQEHRLDIILKQITLCIHYRLFSPLFHLKTIRHQLSAIKACIYQKTLGVCK